MSRRKDRKVVVITDEQLDNALSKWEGVSGVRYFPAPVVNQLVKELCKDYYVDVERCAPSELGMGWDYLKGNTAAPTVLLMESTGWRSEK